ncbi:hypothetical protein, partial [Streptomyces sp. NPDC041003]|uniref:hypothetical protein n=1 Tax=Streptomyces sp. NPDC041003 TaxID=3155730 RepID=UPI0033D93EA7
APPGPGTTAAALTSVFLGNTKLTPEHLRAAPDWLADADDTTYREIATWVRERSATLREACTATGHVYVELGTGYAQGIERAYSTLLEQS